MKVWLKQNARGAGLTTLALGISLVTFSAAYAFEGAPMFDEAVIFIWLGCTRVPEKFAGKGGINWLARRIYFTTHYMWFWSLLWYCHDFYYG